MSKPDKTVQAVVQAMTKHNNLVTASLADMQKVAIERFGANVEEIQRPDATPEFVLAYMRCPVANMICPLAERLLMSPSSLEEAVKEVEELDDRDKVD